MIMANIAIALGLILLTMVGTIAACIRDLHKVEKEKDNLIDMYLEMEEMYEEATEEIKYLKQKMIEIQIQNGELD